MLRLALLGFTLVVGAEVCDDVPTQEWAADNESCDENRGWIEDNKKKVCKKNDEWIEEGTCAQTCFDLGKKYMYVECDSVPIQCDDAPTKKWSKDDKSCDEKKDWIEENKKKVCQKNDDWIEDQTCQQTCWELGSKFAYAECLPAPSVEPTVAPTKAPVSSPTKAPVAQCLENGQIIQAVRKYMNNADNGMFGPIEDWGTSCVDDMASLFYYEKNFNGDVSSWDVGQVTSFSSTFRGARAFNADVSGWDTASATNVNSMFLQAVIFNGNVADWDVSKVVQMEGMFESAVKFTSDLSGWNVNKVTSMCYMLDNTQCEDDDNCGLGNKFIFCDDDDDD